MATQITPTNSTPSIGCEKCDGFGNIFTSEGVTPCECKTKVILATNLANAGIPPMYTRKSFETFHTKSKGQKAAYDRCVRFVTNYEKSSKGLLFNGGCGTGKTHLAVSILRNLINKGHMGLFYNVISLLDDLRASYAMDNSSSQWPILERVSNAEILVLDDLGAEKTSGWVNDRLYAIINHRYEHQKTTLVTTNRDVPDLQEQIGNRIYSRLMEMCQPILFEGEDYRIQMMRSGRT